MAVRFAPGPGYTLRMGGTRTRDIDYRSITGHGSETRGKHWRERELCCLEFRGGEERKGKDRKGKERNHNGVDKYYFIILDSDLVSILPRRVHFPLSASVVPICGHWRGTVRALFVHVPEFPRRGVEWAEVLQSENPSN